MSGTVPSATVVLVACWAAAMGCMVAARGSERRLWWGLAIGLLAFGAYKVFDGQAFVTNGFRAVAHDSGRYGSRSDSQRWIVLAAACSLATIALLRPAARRLPGPARAGAAGAVVLMVYALLNVVSLHGWDRLISRQRFGIEGYTLVETALPLWIGLWAVIARLRSSGHRLD